MLTMKRDTGLALKLAPFGIPTVLIADDSALLATARAAYAEWVTEASVVDPRLVLHLERGSASSAEVSETIAVDGSSLRLHAGDVYGHADAASGRGFGLVPSRLIGDPRALAAELCDTLLLFLLARSGRTPVHAAGILSGGCALVLAGPSGSGKSCLALAAARQGLAVLSDDALHVQTDPVLRIWGMPRPIHLFVGDAPPGPHATRLRAGKLKAVVHLHGAVPPCADSARLVVLARGTHVDLAPIGIEDARSALLPLDPGFDLLGAQSETAIRAIAAGGAWRLTLSHDPDAAIALLRVRWPG